MPTLHRQMQLGFVVIPAAMVIQLGAMLLIANHLGSELWGVFAVILACMQVAGFVTEMGLGTIITKLVAEATRPAGDYIALALPPVWILATAVALVQVVVVCVAYSTSVAGGAAILAGLNILLFGTSLVISCTIRGLGRIGQWQIGFLGQKIVLLAMVVFVLRPFDGGLATTMFAWTVANVFVLVYFAACVWGREWRGQIRWNLLEAKALIAQALPVGLISVTNQLALHLDTFVIAALAGRSAVGVYAISQRLMNPARNVVVGAVITPTFPGLCRLAGSDPLEFARRTSRLMLIQWIAGLGIAFAAYCLAPWVLPVVLGPEFAESVNVLQITAWALPAAFLTLQFRYTYIALTQQRRFLRLNVAFVVLKVVLLLPLTWLYGIWGACVATVAAELVMATVLRLTTASLGIHLKVIRRIVIPALVTAFLVWLIWLVGTRHWVVPVVVTVYGAVTAVVLNRLVKSVRREPTDGPIAASERTDGSTESV